MNDFYKLEAYGTRKDPIFLFSRHNLQIKYETRDPKEIMIGRIQILKSFGYDPNARPLTAKEKEATQALDYLDALLQTYRIRAELPAFAEPYTEFLESNWKPNGNWSEDMDPRPMFEMLSHFCGNMELSQLIVSDYREPTWAKFIRDWHREIDQQLEQDHTFYAAWRNELAHQLGI